MEATTWIPKAPLVPRDFDLLDRIAQAADVRALADEMERATMGSTVVARPQKTH